jgi:hypothetical protein
VAHALGTAVGWVAVADPARTLTEPYLAQSYGLAMAVVGTMLVSAALVSGSLWRRLRVAAWRGRLPRRFGALPSETRPSYERPSGYKVARLVADPSSGEGGFLGLTVGGLYSGDGAAVCEVLTGALPPPRRWGRRPTPALHAAPDLGCSCGFYAFHGRDEAIALLSARPPVSRLFGLVLLEVDFSGTVIEFDRGFRAGQQRVLGVQVPPWCVPCATAGRARPAKRIAGLAGKPLEEASKAELPRHPPLYRLALLVHHTALLERLAGRAALRPVCDEHTPEVVEIVPGSEVAGGEAGEEPRRPTTVVLELADLAARLETEVSWLSDPDFDVAGFVDALSWLPPGNSRAA